MEQYDCYITGSGNIESTERYPNHFNSRIKQNFLLSKNLYQLFSLSYLGINRGYNWERKKKVKSKMAKKFAGFSRPANLFYHL